MRRVVLLWAAIALGSAQPQQPDKKELNLMLDQIRAAIRADDWSEASRLSVRLNSLLISQRSRSQATPSIELQHLEMLAGKDSITRKPLLPRLTKAALAPGDWARAPRHAPEALQTARAG